MITLFILSLFFFIRVVNIVVQRVQNPLLFVAFFMLVVFVLHARRKKDEHVKVAIKYCACLRKNTRMGPARVQVLWLFFL